MGVPLLEVRNLSVNYITMRGVVKALDRVSFDLDENETIAVVGETGSGKSTIAKAIVRVLEENARITRGRLSLRVLMCLSLVRRSLGGVTGGLRWPWSRRAQ